MSIATLLPTAVSTFLPRRCCSVQTVQTLQRPITCIRVCLGHLTLYRHLLTSKRIKSSVARRFFDWGFGRTDVSPPGVLFNVPGAAHKTSTKVVGPNAEEEQRFGSRARGGTRLLINDITPYLLMLALLPLLMVVVFISGELLTAVLYQRHEK